jgi:anti-sigma factor RsiW
MTPATDLTCRELVELVTDYLDGALAPAERTRFERHIAACRGCRTYLEQMRLTMRSLGQLTEEAVPPEAEAALRRAFRGWKRG